MDAENRGPEGEHVRVMLRIDFTWLAAAALAHMTEQFTRLTRALAGGCGQCPDALKRTESE